MPRNPCTAILLTKTPISGRSADSVSSSAAVETDAAWLLSPASACINAASPSSEAITSSPTSTARGRVGIDSCPDLINQRCAVSIRCRDRCCHTLSGAFLPKGVTGAALLRRPFSPLFMGVVARRGCLFGSFCGGQASGQASIGSLSRRQPDGIRLRCGTAPPNTPVWTFPRRSGSVSWEGRFCDGCGGIRLSGCSRSVVMRRLAPPSPRAVAYLSSRDAQQMSESDLERELHRLGQELMDKLLQGTPRATRQPGGGRRSGRENRRSRCHRALATARA